MEQVVLEERLLEEVAVEFEFVKNSMFVRDVYINNAGPFNFIISSDTTDTTLDKATAERLELDLEEAGLGMGLGGQVPIYKAKLKNLEVGEMKIDNFGILVTDLSSISAKFGLEIAGVIANDLLRRFKAIIDYGTNQLKLRKSI